MSPSSVEPLPLYRPRDPRTSDLCSQRGKLKWKREEKRKGESEKGHRFQTAIVSTLFPLVLFSRFQLPVPLNPAVAGVGGVVLAY